MDINIPPTRQFEPERDLKSSKGKRTVQNFLKLHARWNIDSDNMIRTSFLSYHSTTHLTLFRNEESQCISLATPATIRIMHPRAQRVANNVNRRKLANSFEPKMHAHLPILEPIIDILDLTHDSDTVFSIYDPSFIWNAPLGGIGFPAFGGGYICRFMFCYFLDPNTTHRYTIDMETMRVSSEHVSFRLPFAAGEIDTLMEVHFVVGTEDHLIASWTNLNTSFDSTNRQRSNQRVFLSAGIVSIELNDAIREQIVRGFKTYISPVCETLVDGPHGVIPLEFYIQLVDILNTLVQYMYKDDDHNYVTLTRLQNGQHVMSFQTPTMKEPILMTDYETILPLPMRSLNATLMSTTKQRIAVLYKRFMAQTDDFTAKEADELIRLMSVWKSLYGDKDDFVNDKLY